MITFLKKKLFTSCIHNYDKNNYDQNKNELSLNIELPHNSKSNTSISLNNTFKNSKNILNLNDICKICDKELNNENKICDCLSKDELHPNHKETKIKIREKYIYNNQIIQEAIHIDKNYDKLSLLVEDIYDIIEKSTLKEDLTPKTLEKSEENLINEICVHIEDYIKKE